MIDTIFEIKQNPVGNYYFIYHGMQYGHAMISANFSSRAELEKSLVMIRENVAIAGVVVQEGCAQGKEITEGFSSIPYFLLHEVRGGMSCIFKSYEGEVLFSCMCSDLTRCMDGIREMKSHAQNAKVVDRT